MGLHTFLCRKCGNFQAVVPASEMPRTKPCPRCRAKCHKNFEELHHQVIQDTLGYSFKGTSFYGAPVIDSRSSANRALRESASRYGKELAFL